MKLIEGMKLVKELHLKHADLLDKIGKHCATLSIETTEYLDQDKKIAGWLQAAMDITQEILKIRCSIQRTNLATQVTIKLGDKNVTKCISAWIIRRQTLAAMDAASWSKLTDKGLREQDVQSVKDGPVTHVSIKRHFNPEQRDNMLLMFRTEPGIIDRTLEVVNATTDLIEA